MFTKEFSVSTAPEVGRIIDVWNLPSSPDYAFLSGCQNHCLYIGATQAAIYHEWTRVLTHGPPQAPRPEYLQALL
ncbi:hypothetical protein EMIT0P253_240088 [Pseudomonas sp. IT-P253]